MVVPLKLHPRNVLTGLITSPILFNDIKKITSHEASLSKMNQTMSHCVQLTHYKIASHKTSSFRNQSKQEQTPCAIIKVHQNELQMKHDVIAN